MSLPSPLPNLEMFAAALTHHDVRVDQLVVDEKGTICSPHASLSTQEGALQILTGDGAGEILIKGALSKGGMGKILLAEQSSIGRDVAVKVVAPRPTITSTAVVPFGPNGTHDVDPAGSKRTTIAEAELVVEARVAGQLEHPNIVPIHILGLTADRKPIIVMKRIEGESWKALLAKGRELKRDIDILVDVCRALHFAHSRGVIHRDVKPANVMVGSFGEVYLLDWGIAVGFGDNPLPDLPHASLIDAMSGTPQYIAPEMALPKSGPLDARTDVYLAGAVLFEIITGAPPHKGKTLEEMLFAAHTSAAPSFDADVPEELAAICRRALARDPHARFESAEALRLALRAFQEHAVARTLCAEAEAKLATLSTTSAAAATAADDARDVRARTFAECRFAFEQALRLWPESQRAREGLDRAVVAMAKRELDEGRLDAARLLAAELHTVPPSLSALIDDVARAHAAKAANVVELERFAHDHDQRMGSPGRGNVIFGCGCIWFSANVALQILASNDIYAAAGGTFAACLAVIGVFITSVGLAFPTIRSTKSARSLFITMLVADISIAAIMGAGFRFGLPPLPLLVFGHTLLAAVIAILATQDGLLWPATALAAAVPPALMLAPPQYVYVVSACGAFVALAAWAKRWRDLR